MAQQWQKDHPKDVVAARAAGPAGARRQGLQDRRRVPAFRTRGRSGQRRVLNNLAWALDEQGDPRALEYAERAYASRAERARGDRHLRLDPGRSSGKSARASSSCARRAASRPRTPISGCTSRRHCSRPATRSARRASSRAVAVLTQPSLGRAPKREQMLKDALSRGALSSVARRLAPTARPSSTPELHT